MATRRAKVTPTVQEKRYITLHILEAAYVSGTRVVITPVLQYELSSLSGESFVYGKPVETFITYDERPKVALLKSLGWYREDAENHVQIAYIPTHLLYMKYVWNIGESIAIIEPQVQPTDGDKWADIENNLLWIYEVDTWVSYTLPTTVYQPDQAGQYLYNPRTTLLHTAIFAWDYGVTLTIEEPTVDLTDGLRWFDKATDSLYTYDLENTAWVETPNVPTTLYDPMSVDLLYFEEATNRLFISTYGERVVNEVLLDGTDTQLLVQTGESPRYIMKDLLVKRGTLVDVFYDFAPDARGETIDGGDFNDQQTYLGDGGSFYQQYKLEADMGGFNDDSPYDFPVDDSIVINRFYVTEPRTELSSIHYICKIAPYKYQAAGEAEPEQNVSNGSFLKFDSSEHDA